MIKGDITESDETIDIEMTIRQGDSILDREIVPLRCETRPIFTDARFEAT